MAYFSFTHRIATGRPIEVYGHGAPRRDFTYIDDVVDGVVGALGLAAEEEIFNLGNHRSESLLHFIEARVATSSSPPISPADSRDRTGDCGAEGGGERVRWVAVPTVGARVAQVLESELGVKARLPRPRRLASWAASSHASALCRPIARWSRWRRATCPRPMPTSATRESDWAIRRARPSRWASIASSSAHEEQGGRSPRHLAKPLLRRHRWYRSPRFRAEFAEGGEWQRTRSNF